MAPVDSHEDHDRGADDGGYDSPIIGRRMLATAPAAVMVLTAVAVAAVVVAS